jgi:hypothetical protein
MAGVLDRIFLAEEIAPGMARLRLAGQSLCGLMGMEVRGMPLSALFEPMSRGPLEAPLARVFTGDAAVTVDLCAESGIGRPALAGRLLLLPLAGLDGRPDMTLGCLSLTGETGRTPRRLILQRWTAEPLSVTRTWGPAPAPAQREAAEAAAPFVHAPPAAPRAPHLRLVTSDQPTG